MLAVTLKEQKGSNDKTPPFELGISMIEGSGKNKLFIRRQLLLPLPIFIDIIEMSIIVIFFQAVFEMEIVYYFRISP